MFTHSEVINNLKNVVKLSIDSRMSILGDKEVLNSMGFFSDCKRLTQIYRKKLAIQALLSKEFFKILNIQVFVSMLKLT